MVHYIRFLNELYTKCGKCVLGLKSIFKDWLICFNHLNARSTRNFFTFLSEYKKSSNKIFLYKDFYSIKTRHSVQFGRLKNVCSSRYVFIILIRPNSRCDPIQEHGNPAVDSRNVGPTRGTE